MPSAAIDTFFACTLIISVALIATASLTATMQTNINNLQDLNKQSYLRTTAEQIVTSYGSPVDWGSSDMTPDSFGLAQAGGSQIYALDVDKICRLNSQSGCPLSYSEVSKAARLSNIALGITVTQILSITIEPLGNTTIGETTTYNFKITVKANLEPTSANLQCDVIAKDALSSVSNATSSAGIGYVSFQLPNSSNGAVLLVVFARATFDDRLTAYETYMFPHLSQETLPNQTFLDLSPLNNKLSVNTNFPNTTIDDCDAFSYAYQAKPTLISSGTYEIPELLDKSPMVLVASGFNESTYFVEWCAYPSVPLSFGSNFANTEQNTFVYTVSIKDTLYKLTVTLGDMTK